jgi:hypothetical protein
MAWPWQCTEEWIDFGEARLKNEFLILRMSAAGAIGLVVVLQFQACSRLGDLPIQNKTLGFSSFASSVPGSTTTVHVVDEKFFETLPKGAQARSVLCTNPIPNDGVANVFCSSAPPRVTNFSELQTALNLGFKNVTATAQNGAGGNPGFALIGHSNSLVMRGVSTLNPRAIIFTPGAATPTSPFVTLAFTRGEQFAEIIAKDLTTGNLTFYVFRFFQSCNSKKSCSMGELITPAVEKNWTGFDIYRDDPFFKNSAFDCRHCHQPNAANPSRLGMREIASPFTHWFSSQTVGGRALLSDFQAAHGNLEDYAGIPARLLPKSDPGLLQTFVTGAGFGLNLPNPYPSDVVEQEVKTFSPLQPEDNRVAGKSSTWDTLFSKFLVTGLTAPPFHDVKESDPVKLSAMIRAYQDYRAGKLPLAQLPDIRETFPDDPALLSKMGLGAQPGLDARSLLTNACMQCHNSLLDQTIDRAKFSVDRFDQMSRTEKDLAIYKINQPADGLQLMPPARFRALTTAEKKLLTDYLKQ